MKKLLLTLAALGTAAIAAPASATVEVTTGTNVGCGSGPLSPAADKCAGYFSGNEFSGNSADVAQQQAAIDLLLGGPGKYTVDWDALKKAGKVVSSSDVAAFNALMEEAGGQVLIGLHWGNVPSGQGNVSAFYLWENAKAGSINLTDTKGYSNAVLYRAAAVTTAVPEPGTWALMLVGFGAVGGSLRRRRRETHIPQFA